MSARIGNDSGVTVPLRNCCQLSNDARNVGQWGREHGARGATTRFEGWKYYLFLNWSWKRVLQGRFKSLQMGRQNFNRVRRNYMLKRNPPNICIAFNALCIELMIGCKSVTAYP